MPTCPSVVSRWLLLFVILHAVACDRGPGHARAPAAGASTAQGNKAARDTAKSSGEVSLAPDSTLRAWLSDANIVSLAVLLNAKQVAAANVELERWHSDSVRTFAEGMLHEHAVMQRQLDSVARALHLAPVAPALGQYIGATLQAQIDAMAGLTSRALEDAYLRQQVASHQALIEYATQLGAAADEPQLQALLDAQKTRFKGHLSSAQTLQRALATGDSIHLADSTAADSARAARGKRKRQTGG